MPRKKSGALVCQYIENLSSGALKEYENLIREIVGRRHGVYALYKGHRLYYVGLASNLRSRLKAHLKDRHKGLWDRFSVYLTIDDVHMKELESLLIRIASPRGNSQRGNFARSENLTRTLRRRFFQQQRDSWHRLVGPRAPSARKPQGKRVKSSARHALAKYTREAFPLRATFKNKTYRARVRSDGSIRYAGKIHPSPSTAASAVIGGAANGWNFWTYERAPGQWVRLKELRQR